MKRDLYADVTDRILAQLETGTVPWVKPWRARPGNNMPVNAATNRPYSGCNIAMLWLAMAAHDSWTAPRFLTFKQAIAIGGNVRKGEKGTKVYFVKRMATRDTSEPADSDAAVRSWTMLREFTVFNVAQCDNLPAHVVTPKPLPVRNRDQRSDDVEKFINITGAEIRENGDVAAFYPSKDFIGMPTFESFDDADSYYGVLTHELGHWTGHKSRLDRDLTGRFGDQKYAAEELIAELTSAFICAEFAIDGTTRHATYIASWIKLLKSDKRAFFTAAAAAQKAADYLRGKALADAEQQDEKEAA